MATLTAVARGARRCLSDPLAISRLVRHAAIAAYADRARGLMLDVGAGRQPYADLFDGGVRRIVAVEFPTRSPRAEVDVLADAQALPFRAASVDTVLCAEVLQYLARPADAVREFARVLRSGGQLLLVTPQLRGESDEANDYWRFARPGLALLARSAGLTAVEIVPCGGLLAACGQRASSAAYASLASRLPRRVAIAISAAIQLPAWLLEQLGLGRGETLHWLLAARKP